ncbi:hypothetical protein [Zhongshania sp. BJYM1]|uniref:hypothetical protein n=1 Tax=Zhongshania aquatica TaxID=2965069 RepID=UPI0022B3787E|nr:hypothetical protein [Marortus sp. BJYM1]
MNTTKKLAIGMALGITIAGTVIAADISGTREDDLQKQIIQLRKEINELKSIVQKEPDGSLRIPSDMQVDRGISTTSIQNISTNLDISSRRDLNIETSKKMLIDAGDELTLKSGKAFITLKKNGNITISGAVLDIRGSSDVKIKGASDTTIKGSKVQQN